MSDKFIKCPHCGEEAGWDYEQQYCGNCDFGSNNRLPIQKVTYISRAAGDVLVERQRQIEQEKFTLEHDDENVDSELIGGALCYTLIHWPKYIAGLRPQRLLPDLWPWEMEWWKPTNRRRDLVKAAALTIAEIERIDREQDSNRLSENGE